MKATADKSATITYKLIKINTDGTEENATTAEGKVDSNGKVTFQNVKGFYYLEATITPTGEGAEKKEKALLLVGAVPIPTGAIVPDAITQGEGSKALKTAAGLDRTMRTVTLKLTSTYRDGGTTRIMSNIQKDKEFTVLATVDMTQFPPEAPQYAPIFQYKTQANKPGVNRIIASIGINTGTITTGTGIRLSSVEYDIVTVEAVAVPLMLHYPVPISIPYNCDRFLNFQYKPFVLSGFFTCVL